MKLPSIFNSEINLASERISLEKQLFEFVSIDLISLLTVSKLAQIRSFTITFSIFIVIRHKTRFSLT